MIKRILWEVDQDYTRIAKSLNNLLVGHTQTKQKRATLITWKRHIVIEMKTNNYPLALKEKLMSPPPLVYTD